MSHDSAKVAALLGRVREAVAAGRVRVTDYALEGAEALGWDAWDVAETLRDLRSADFLRCEESRLRAGEVIWVFTPEFEDGGSLWIRLRERAGVLVVSFHRG